MCFQELQVFLQSPPDHHFSRNKRLCRFILNKKKWNIRFLKKATPVTSSMAGSRSEYFELVSGCKSPFISHGIRPFGRGPITPGLGDLRSPWLLATYVRHGMILQVGHPKLPKSWRELPLPKHHSQGPVFSLSVIIYTTLKIEETSPKKGTGNE